MIKQTYPSRSKAGKRTAAPLPTESEEQQQVFIWAEIQSGTVPSLRLMHHIPNGGKRGKAEAGRFKAEGVKPGVPDIFLPVARWGYHGLYIEMKRIGEKTRKDQDIWIAALRGQGYKVEVCHGCNSAIQAICSYMSIKPPQTTRQVL